MFLRFIFSELLTPQPSKKKLCTLLIALECKQDTQRTNSESLQPEACITHYTYIPTSLSLEIHSSSNDTFVSNQKYICFYWCKALSKWLPPGLCVQAQRVIWWRSQRGCKGNWSSRHLCLAPDVTHRRHWHLHRNIYGHAQQRLSHTRRAPGWSAELLHPGPLSTALTASDKPPAHWNSPHGLCPKKFMAPSMETHPEN